MKIIRDILPYAIATIAVLPCAAISGSLGSRGESTEYKFQYHGKSAEIIREDVRFTPQDKYFLLIDNKDLIKEGELTADNGDIIRIQADGYFIIPKKR